jgi:transcriptional regulator with XRE-family HTH domain
MASASERFRKRLTDLTAAHGAVSELARTSGLSRSVIDKWLEGGSVPSIDNVERVAEALNLSIGELLGPEPERPRPWPAMKDLFAALSTLDESEVPTIATALSAAIRTAKGHAPGSLPRRNEKK